MAEAESSSDRRMSREEGGAGGMSGEDAHLQTASLLPALLVTSVSPLVTITCSYFVPVDWFGF